MINLKSTAEELRREIEAVLSDIGILCRVFGRSKSDASLKEKLEKIPEKYQLGHKLIQDLIGIRVVLYFQEDIEIVKKILCDKYLFDLKSSTIDLPENDQFSVTRYNLIYKLPETYISDFDRQVKNQPVDTTFELQLRTILSEGWHEVDHDLRYKCKDNWDSQLDLSRAFNSISATLEISEWSMRKIFDDLAYRHYKAKNWSAMMHNKLRLRVQSNLSDEIKVFFDSNGSAAKDMLRVDRADLINSIYRIKVKIPINLDNIVYVWNHNFLRHPELSSLTPDVLLELLDR